MQSAHAMGRYAQTIGPAKAISRGYVSKIRKSLEEALALDPEMAAAHLSLATWHAEAIAGAGLVARLTFGASKKRALSHYEKALLLAPDETVVYVEYANGLLHLNRKKNRERARELLARAIEDAAEGRLRPPAASTGGREAREPGRRVADSPTRTSARACSGYAAMVRPCMQVSRGAGPRPAGPPCV